MGHKKNRKQQQVGKKPNSTLNKNGIAKQKSRKIHNRNLLEKLNKTTHSSLLSEKIRGIGSKPLLESKNDIAKRVLNEQKRAVEEYEKQQEDIMVAIDDLAQLMSSK
ncbi:hypothetical protein BB559_002312 [Furculomyces boomerangus]|uniref:Uncharacterized protein n=2 Tax=Harpellales TaxID=61421 RepID=A0A2T9YWF0_9FUNG|nr:hypothetical protein BB559_002312 [Furculomyces boomerangus]PWA03663.1 hypothetical protein BB558_000170 [Smittium angustum]